MPKANIFFPTPTTALAKGGLNTSCLIIMIMIIVSDNIIAGSSLWLAKVDGTEPTKNNLPKTPAAAVTKSEIKVISRQEQKSDPI